MSLADSNRVRLSYVKEATFGTAVTNPALQILRLTSSDFAANKQTAVSDELRYDRMTGDLIETAFDSGGSFNIEMSLGDSYDTADGFIEGAMCADFSTVLPPAAGTLDIVAATKTITDAATSGQFTNVEVGQWVLFGGFVAAGNNGWFKVASITSVEIIVVEDPGAVLVNASGTGVETARGKSVINGTDDPSFMIEQAFTDVELYQLFLGQRVGTWAMNVESGSILTGSFGFQGTEVQTDTVDPASWLGSGSYPAATTTGVLNATSNVGTIVKDGVALSTAIQSFDMELDNALRNQNAIGSKYPIGIGYGRVTISGTLSAYFEDMTLYDEMIAHSDVSLEFNFVDTAGNAMHLEFPKVKFAASAPSPGGIDQDVIEDLEWQAIVDDAGTFMMRVDVANIP
jgi:hypothetical protein